MAGWLAGWMEGGRERDGWSSCIAWHGRPCCFSNATAWVVSVQVVVVVLCRAGWLAGACLSFFLSFSFFVFLFLVCWGCIKGFVSRLSSLVTFDVCFFFFCCCCWFCDLAIYCLLLVRLSTYLSTYLT
ncbi:hypothetical protein BO70DRAFT_145372 [Aspergillus heteromorphus CBS 117.55]|uniref:Uncharacterized protein n=1 Tax=Aspergillus heteromorphus CBS 117.55 TaxID=1448321 RepID=A0A317V9R1_9EURO|nr:uncharacterized protein BO70DRAFT_145372 [Aspergillus heteromorphus CBS 117.55]PWY69737.1 hypothetical protein BO70DRAFT_145372 [Aspergillus heteromorphus CBS 117.55]